MEKATAQGVAEVKMKAATEAARVHRRQCEQVKREDCKVFCVYSRTLFLLVYLSVSVM